MKFKFRLYGDIKFANDHKITNLEINLTQKQSLLHLTLFKNSELLPLDQSLKYKATRKIIFSEKIRFQPKMRNMCFWVGLDNLILIVAYHESLTLLWNHISIFIFDLLFLKLPSFSSFWLVAVVAIPEDLYHLIKKADNVRKHIEKFRADVDGKFRLILIESRIHRLARYYRKAKALPPTWRYVSKKADTLLVWNFFSKKWKTLGDPPITNCLQPIEDSK